MKIIPNLTTKVIDASSFNILSTGYFSNSGIDASINIQLEMKDDLGQIYFTNDGAIYANIQENELVSFTVTDHSIIFPGTVDYSDIDIQIVNSNFPDDGFGVVTNIRIV